MNDLKLAFRHLHNNPGFTAAAVLTLALAIGANTAVFSVVDAVLLRPLRYPDSERLVWLSERHPHFPVMSIAYPDFCDWRIQQSVFEQIGVYNSGSYNLTGEGTPLRLRASRISAGALAALQVQPAFGRLFREDEDQTGAPPVLLLSHKLWVTRFGRSAEVVNRSVTLDGHSWTVVGVMPADFAFPDPVDVWVPLAQVTSEPTYQNRGNRPGLLGVARLKPGVSLAQARSQMDAISARLERQYPETNKSVGVRVDPLIENRVGSSVRTALYTILGAVGMVLMIACSNVSNLLLARAAARRREMAVRAALGASRWRIIRQLLSESVLLALVGGGVGLLLAVWGLKLILVLSGDALPRANEITLDIRMLAFTAVTSILTGVVFGLAPAWQASRLEVQDALQQTARGVAAGQTRLRQGLIVGEVALSLLLLVGAGLMLRTFYRLQTVNPGFNHERVLSFRLDLPLQKYGSVERQISFYQTLVEKLGSLPGVQHVGVAYQFPLAQEGWQTAFQIEGRPELPPGERPSMELTPVSPDYFRAMGIRLLRGSYFTDADNREHLRGRDLSTLTEGQQRNAGLNAIIVDEEFARRYWPNEDPIGKRVLLPAPALTVVGVVNRVKLAKLGEQGGFVQAYIPLWQYGGAGRAVVMKTAFPPENFADAVRQTVHSLDPDQPIYDLRTLSAIRHHSLAPERLNVMLLGSFAGVAMLLAAIGIYGVLAYTVAQRTQEIGIRMALGARRRDVLRLVLSHGIRLTLLGIALGLIGAFGLTHLLTRLLYEVKPTDPLTFFAVPLVLLSVALLACWHPARHAANLHPIDALRCE